MWSTALWMLSTVGGPDGGGFTLDVVRLDGSHCFLTAVSLTAPSASGVAGAPPDTLLVASVARGMVAHGSAGVRRVPGPPPSPVTAELQAPVRALAVIAGRVVAGVGTTLRVFELAKRRLLRKADLRRAVPNLVVALAVSAPDRLWVADVQSSPQKRRWM
ncbi:hypothetical protein I4F81_003574 [Pyropia yezoensis]|uniref:Uncharacterized protein n=1 Tax=Pyropia yezoensis TaxID=2788 RepID=A0ACC3BSU1_PYRYE|nr:hypothetical protein I4F81_003574 [Neopyropia yezoensis]